MFNIVFDFKKNLGGGKVFLNNLKKDLEILNIYSNVKNANYIIFNSHHNLLKIILLKFIYYDKIFLHRIDGPIFIYRNSNKFLDNLIFHFSNIISNGIIFQSKWSYEKNKFFFNFNKNYIILNNYSDVNIFKKKSKVNISNNKLKIVSSCWSVNKNKGIATYYYLDKKLNFNNYEFFFIGNNDLEFKNIINLGKKQSNDIAKILKDADIFLSPSLYESCSNSVVEALTVGLFVFYKENTSNDEIVENGKSYKDDKDLVHMLNSKNFNIKKLSTVPIDTKRYINELRNFSSSLESDQKRKYLNLFFLTLYFFLFSIYTRVQYYKFKILNLFN